MTWHMRSPSSVLGHAGGSGSVFGLDIVGRSSCVVWSASYATPKPVGNAGPSRDCVGPVSTEAAERRRSVRQSRAHWDLVASYMTTGWTMQLCELPYLHVSSPRPALACSPSRHATFARPNYARLANDARSSGGNDVPSAGCGSFRLAGEPISLRGARKVDESGRGRSRRRLQRNIRHTKGSKGEMADSKREHREFTP